MSSPVFHTAKTPLLPRATSPHPSWWQKVQAFFRRGRFSPARKKFFATLSHAVSYRKIEGVRCAVLLHTNPLGLSVYVTESIDTESFKSRHGTVVVVPKNSRITRQFLHALQELFPNQTIVQDPLKNISSRADSPLYSPVPATSLLHSSASASRCSSPIQ